MPTTIPSALLSAAVLRALRHWLLELGHRNATIGLPSAGVPDVYHLLDVGRIVRVITAIAPSYPARLTTREIRALRAHARRRGARAWEAHVILRSNFHPAAIVWRNLEPGAKPAASGTALARPR